MALHLVTRHNLEMVKKFFEKYFMGSFFLNAPLAINAAVALAALPIILANLPVVDYGKFQFVLALQVWVSAFTAGNITAGSKRGIAKGLDGTFFYAFWQRLKLLVVAGVVVLGAVFYFRVSGKHMFSTLLAIAGLYLILGYLFQISLYEFLIGKKRFKECCFWQISIPVVSTVASTTAAFATKSIVYFALFQLGSLSVLSWIGWVWMVRKEGLIESYQKGQIDKECVPYGVKLIPFDLFNVTAARISDFIIGAFFGFGNLAIFSVASKLRDRCSFLIRSTRPLLYADFANSEREKLTGIVNRHLLKIGALGLILTLGFIGLGWFYIEFFLPETYGPAVFYFILLALGLPPSVLAAVLQTVLESHLRYRELTVIGIAPNLLRIILILFFGYFWEIIGVCIALSVSGWISFGFYYLLTLRKESAKTALENFPFLERLSKYLKPVFSDS